LERESKTSWREKARHLGERKQDILERESKTSWREKARHLGEQNMT